MKGGPAAPAPRLLEVSQEERDVLASLPPRARSLLQEPFLHNDEEILRCDSYWEGYGPDHLDPVVLAIASGRRVTVAVGQRMIPAKHDETTAHWTLTCWYAQVTHRTGK